jgi:hypothetical protein
MEELVDEEGERIVAYSILTLISFTLTLYFYKNPGSGVDRSTLMQISGRLADTPESHTSSENPAYISIALMGDNARYELEGCSFYNVSQRLLDMHTKDSIKLTVEIEDYKNRTSLVNSSVAVLAVDDGRGHSFLSIDVIDLCQKHSWRVMLRLSYFCLAFTIIASAGRIWNFLKAKN